MIEVVLMTILPGPILFQSFGKKVKYGMGEEELVFVISVQKVVDLVRAIVTN